MKCSPKPQRYSISFFSCPFFLCGALEFRKQLFLYETSIYHVVPFTSDVLRSGDLICIFVYYLSASPPRAVFQSASKHFFRKHFRYKKFTLSFQFHPRRYKKDKMLQCFRCDGRRSCRKKSLNIQLRFVHVYNSIKRKKNPFLLMHCKTNMLMLNK